MAGKISNTEENLKIGCKLNSNIVKVSSSKSILSYQNGSASNVEGGECMTDEGMPADGCSEETSLSEEPFPENHNLKSECLDKLRKKLIFDLSLSVFSTDLENKLTKMEPFEISKERQSVIQKLIIQISQLSDVEKLLLYLKLPSSTNSTFDPLRQPLNPLGNRQEIQQTIVWIKTHLEEDSEISIPKQDVYDQYLKYCENVSMKPLSTADFGKVMKQVYPGVRPRRLGTRGNSRYCYSGMRNTCKLPTPILPQGSIESSTLNGIGSDDPTNFKKNEKTKRKWKSLTCQNEKCTTSSRTCVNSGKCGVSHLKNAKRSKMEEAERRENSEEDDDKKSEKIKDVDLSNIKCEESSNNSFNAFDLDCNDFGIYLKDAEKADDVSSRSATLDNSFSGSESESKISVVSQTQPNLEEDSFPLISEKQLEKGNVSGSHIANKINGQGSNKRLFDHPKSTKGRSRKSNFNLKNSTKNFKKTYVPIQPKPAEPPKLSVLFEHPISQLSADKKELDEPTLCEESDSQEPEEEIVRYFKHLDEKEINAGDINNHTDKNIENNAVQISQMCQITSKNSSCQPKMDDILNQTTQHILRSQSCLEVPRGLLNLGENSDTIYVPRSQSSVELPMLNEHSSPDSVEHDSGLDGKKKKISHLRILLEKSMTSSKNSYSSLKNGSNFCNSVMPNAQLSHSMNLKDPNFLLSSPKSVNRDLFKLNNLKVVSKNPSFVPQSPNTRTKYFSFTPISPGPQSPLRTPSTPSASPFVSPRNTPVPRTKPNFHNDFFLSPSERKSAPLRTDSVKGELVQENVFNFSKILENQKVEENKPPSYLQTCRPRSFSSTNFCRTKTRRNSVKTPFHRATDSMPKNRIQVGGQNNFTSNSQFSIHRNFVSSDSLSSEVRKFLENNSKILEGQSEMIRSQSVPLNRMSESAWMPAQASPIFSGYYNSGTSHPTLAISSGKFSDWVTNSDSNTQKEITPTNISPFIENGEITNLASDSFNNEIFSGDSTVQINGQYFPGDFPPGSEENFPENEPFREESGFSNKLDLNTNSTFDSAFVSDSDPAIADSIKSYLPDFEGLENKDLVGPTGNGDGISAERKLFKNVLYGGGNDNLKDPVITSFKPVLMNEISSCPGSPVLNFFGTKANEDNQQLIELFGFEE